MENNSFETSMAPGAAESGIPRPGAALAAARLARKMSVEDVSRLLKLSLNQVRAIEADDHSALPSAMFARGFIRSYARLLHVDIEPLMPEKVPPVEITDARSMRRVPGVPIEPRRNGHGAAMIAGVVLVLAGLAYYEFALNTASAPFQIASNSPGQASSATTPGNDDPTSLNASLAPRSAAPIAAAPPVVASANEPLAAPAAGDHLLLKKSIDPTSGVNEKGLHFLFNGESWVEVRDRVGKVVFSKTNAPGSERIVQGEPPFSLVIGGASGVRLNYNGSPVNLASYVTEDVARLRLE